MLMRRIKLSLFVHEHFHGKDREETVHVLVDVPVHVNENRGMQSKRIDCIPGFQKRKKFVDRN